MSKDINKTDEQGRKQGYWVEEYLFGDVREGPYVDGKRHGHWVWRGADGEVMTERNYVDGVEQGRMVVRYPDGTVRERNYVDDVLQGRGVTWHPDGRVKHVTFRNGVKVDEEWVQ